MKIWFKMMADNHLIKDITVENHENDTRTHKVFAAVSSMCRSFDLPSPIWLESNISEFKKYSRVRFQSDSFVEEVDFDYIDMQVLEEDALFTP